MPYLQTGIQRKMNEIIYLDYAATTPVDDRVIEAMLPFMGHNGLFANSGSNHLPGKKVKNIIESSRATLLGILNAKSHELVFTSGATEANNLVFRSLIDFGFPNRLSQIITCKTEHKAVLEPIRYLEQRGINVTYLNPNSDGLIECNDLITALKKGPALISVMWVNNETGVIQNIQKIAQLAKEHHAIFHCDAAQAFGKLAIDLDTIDIDLLSISGHKVYGPKGVGALIVRNEILPSMQAQIIGGDQEHNLRAGTLASQQIVAFSKAAEIAYAELDGESKKQRELAQVFLQGLNKIPGAVIHGATNQKLPSINNISFDCVNSRYLQKMIAEHVAISLGSACNSESLEPSYVLKAMGLSDDLASSSIRLSFGRYTTQEEIIKALKFLEDSVALIREQSKVWRMKNSILFADS